MKLTRLKSNRPRRKHDFYPTPYGLAKAALQKLKDDELDYGSPYEILDAGCGEGIWMDAALDVWKGDLIAPYGIDFNSSYSGAIIGDFLKCDNRTLNGNYVSMIYGNPPYSFMEEFIRHALDADLLFTDGYVYFLGRLEFLASKKRCFGLFKEYPLKRIYVLSRRPSFFSTNGHKTTDAQDYAMYLWQKDWTGKSELDWLYWDYDEELDYIHD